MVGLISTLALLTVGAQQNMTFRPHLKSVSIFRDGYGYFVKEGKVKLEDGWATANFVPSAVDGTVWVYSADSNAMVDEVVATKANKIDFKDAASLKDALQDKIGLDFTVTMKGGQTFTGSLNRLLNDMLLLNDGSGFSGLPYDNIQTVVLNGFPLKVHVTGVNANAEVNLSVAYLQEGVSWQPSYVLNVNNGVGNLQLRASLQNTVQDFNGANLNFVVGSPFVSQRGINDLFGTLSARPFHRGDADSAKDSDKKAAADPDMPTVQATPQLGPLTTPDEAGELYYYKKPDVHLDQGDVAMMTLASMTGAINPSFNWNADGDAVNYEISFKNTLPEPLTTGAVLVIDNGKAAGQDMLQYVPSGGIAKLKLAQGIGLHVTHKELETKRGGPINLGKTSYIPVTLEGTLTVENHRKSSILINISKTVRGKVLSITNGGVIKNTEVLNGEANSINLVNWKVNVDPDKEVVIHYTYQQYVSSDAAGSPPVPIYPNDVP